MSDRYEILSKLGQGGIGAVYRARDLTLAREVAIKRLLPQEEKPEEAKKTGEYLIHEAGMLSKLQHPNIVHVFEAAMDEEGAYIVMELVQGETLDKVVEQGAMKVRDFVSMMQQALEALIAAQAIGMMHRDLKPTNVMLKRQRSGRFDLKVLDFGLAKISAQPALQTIDHGNSILGSIYFMAPEQFEHVPLDGRTDLYALGCLGYYALTGEYPFQGDTAAMVMDSHLEHRVTDVIELRPSLPLPLAEWLMRMLSLSVDERPVDAHAALREIDDIVSKLPKGTLEETVPVEKKPALVTGTAAIKATAARKLATTSNTITAREKTGHALRPPMKAKTSPPWLAPVAVAGLIVVAGVIALALIDGSDAKTTDNNGDPGSPEVPAIELAPLRTKDWINANGAFLPHKMKGSRPLEKLAHGNFKWAALTPAAELIPKESEWYFWPPGKFTAPPKQWKKAGQKKNGWVKGRAPIGFSNGTYFQKGTLLASMPTPPGDKPFAPLYLRNEFLIDDTATPGPLEVFLRADDGAVVYVNGAEVRRVGMPNGTINAYTPATRKVTWTGTTSYVAFRVHEKHVRKGLNMIAVRVHPRNIPKRDKDIGFDAAVYLLPPGSALNPPNDFAPVDKPKFVAPHSRKSPQDWKFTTELDLLSAWESPDFNDRSWKSGSAPFGITAKGSNFPVRTPWSSENLFLRRTFTLNAADLKDENGFTFAIRTNVHATISVNGTYALEIKNPLMGRFHTLSMSKQVHAALKEGENVIAVHLGNNADSRFFDLGITRAPPKMQK